MRLVYRLTDALTVITVHDKFPEEVSRMNKKMIEMFQKIRDVSDDVVKAGESGDEREQEAALGRFVFISIQLGNELKTGG